MASWNVRSVLPIARGAEMFAERRTPLIKSATCPWLRKRRRVPGGLARTLSYLLSQRLRLKLQTAHGQYVVSTFGFAGFVRPFGLLSQAQTWSA